MKSTKWLEDVLDRLGVKRGHTNAIVHEIVDAIPFRASVWDFAIYMEMQLARNESKGGWESDPVLSLFARASTELGELGSCLLESQPDRPRVIAEAADVANFAMMIASIADAERTGKRINGRPVKVEPVEQRAVTLSIQMPVDVGPCTTGHGHVYKRTDGVFARCGGPKTCPECARDFAAECKRAFLALAERGQA